ncbi:DUF1996 domain-containing protein [Actinoplanes sp. NPDC026619]|uniref:DUF1996 domain-containing protein n=1 Tax=Actinoplanes sp. NPDC026619 TaxID=3155798 RepID=UPI0033F78555
MRALLRGAAVLVLVAASLLSQPGGPAQAAVSGQWKVDCNLSHSSMDDPIVFPALPGASHMHDFFGNAGTNAYSTLATMQGVTSTCAKNDRSAYWAPALYRDGVKVNPSSFIAYYENRFADDVTLTAFPAGFQMVFGNKAATTAAQVDAHITWGCSDSSQLGGKEPPAACASGGIQLRLMWPYCWDGKTLSSPNTAHVSFAPGGVCPAAFPIAMPTIRTNIFYPVGTTTGTVTFASGSVYSVHADFFNAWDQPTLEDLVTRCLNGHTDCGHFTGTSPGTDPAPTSTTTTTATASAAAPTQTTQSTTAAVTPAPATTTLPSIAAAAASSPAASSAGHTVAGTAARPASPRWTLTAASATHPIGLIAAGLLAATGGALFLRRRNDRRSTSKPV